MWTRARYHTAYDETFTRGGGESNDVAPQRSFFTWHFTDAATLLPERAHDSALSTELTPMMPPRPPPFLFWRICDRLASHTRPSYLMQTSLAAAAAAATAATSAAAGTLGRAFALAFAALAFAAFALARRDRHLAV